jgi:hypothetical protein
MGFALLLGPVVVVEEGSVFRTLAEWWRLLSQYFGQVFLFEVLALGIGLLTTVPLFLPLVLAAGGRFGGAGLDNAIGWTVLILAGLAAAPLIAYLPVANVFIYLNLRYESAPRR